MSQPESEPIFCPQEEGLTSWEYVRVEALAVLPGLLCPHFDKTQSNGVLRATDFDAMLKRCVFVLLESSDASALNMPSR
jgi:hypothetical protein